MSTMPEPILAPDPGRSVLAAGGAVVAGEPLAAAAGIWALAEGGHAVDAALAVAGVTAVTMPEMCGFGGDAFALVYDSASREVTGFNGSGPAPMAASVRAYRDRGFEEMPFVGWWSIAVPGAVGVYMDLHRRYGRLPLARLWAPAMRYAREGFPIGRRLAANIALEAEKLARDEAASAVYLAGGLKPHPDWILKNLDLARSFEIVLDGGEEAFYQGALAKAVGEASARAGGLLTAEDMASQRTDVYRPLSTTYRGHTVFQTKPPSQGLILLEELNLIEGFDLSGQSPTDPGVIHLMVEAKKIAFADRNACMGDPSFVDAPTDLLISKEWAARRRAEIDPSRASRLTAADERHGDTTSFVCVDREGNAVSFIHSMSALFGACVMVPGTGIILNNRAGRGFVLEEGHPNVLAPGKRTMHTLNTYLVTRPDGGKGDGECVLVGNTPGGDGQPQWNMQAISNVIDFGMDVYGAVAAPRWTSLPGTDPIGLKRAPEVRLESRFPESTGRALGTLGHTVRVTGPWAGGGSAMLIHKDGGVLEAAADPRDGGQALGI